MAANEVEYMGIVVDLDVSGSDKITNAAKEISKILLKNGEDADTAKQELGNFFDLINHKLVSMGKSPIMKDHIKMLIQASLKTAKQELDKAQAELDKALKGENKPESELAKRRGMFADFTESRMGKAVIALKSLNAAFSESRGVLKFADGIEKVNQRLLLMSYSSGIGISSLKDLGAAAKAFGGSAESIASAEERRLEQISRAKRGEGFGYLQEAHWKYGFNIDLGWDANRTREEAIRYARANLDQSDWLAFAKSIDPAMAKPMLAAMGLSDEEFAKWEKWQEALQQYGNLETAGERRQARMGKNGAVAYRME